MISGGYLVVDMGGYGELPLESNGNGFKASVVVGEDIVNMMNTNRTPTIVENLTLTLGTSVFQSKVAYLTCLSDGNEVIYSTSAYAGGVGNFFVTFYYTDDRCDIYLRGISNGN